MDTALGSLENIRDGDCIVCFSKQHIFSLSRELEKLGRQVAVIYGSLPPGKWSLHAVYYTIYCSVIIAVIIMIICNH